MTGTGPGARSGTHGAGSAGPGGRSGTHGAGSAGPGGRSRTRRWLPETGPQRAFAFANLVNNIGTGLFLSSSALFYHRVVGLPVDEIGLGLTCAGAVGLAGRVPIGRISDLRGPRGTFAATLVAQGLLMASYLAVHSFPAFLAAVSLYLLAAGGSTSARGPLVRQLGGTDPTAYRAYLRSANNLGIAAGALLANWALELDTPMAYRTLVVGNAASFLLAALALLRVPGRPAVRRARAAHRWTALRDRPYVVMSVVNGLMNIQFSMLGYAMPLWIVTETVAPRWTIGARMVINTLGVALFQVRASRGVHGTGPAARSFRRAGPVFLVAAVLVAVTADVHSAWEATALVCVAACVHVLGELWHQAGSIELGYRLAPPDAQGEYQGVFGLGQGVAGTVGPALLTLLCLDGGQPGWIAIGLFFTALGACMPRITAWAEAERSTSGASDDGEAPLPSRVHAVAR